MEYFKSLLLKNINEKLRNVRRDLKLFVGRPGNRERPEYRDVDKIIASINDFLDVEFDE